MPSSSCRFCRHANPPDSKFCNECGSPLHLRPCPRCEAVTDAGAGVCHQCGAAFDAEDAAIVAATAHAAATNEARADDPQTHRDRTPPSPRDTAARPRISIRGDEDDDAPASSELTRIAEPGPSTHIPEWLAERFDAANRAGAAGGRTHVSGTDAHASSAPDTPGCEREEAPSRSLLADYDARRPRRRLSPLLAVAAVAIAAGAYYVWFDAQRSVPVTTSTPPTPSAPAAAAVPTLPAAHGKATASPAPVAPTSSSPAAAPEPLAMPPPRAPRARTERGNGAAAAANAQARRATSDAERPTNRTAQRERDADETRRLIERDLGGLLRRPPERSAQ